MYSVSCKDHNEDKVHIRMEIWKDFVWRNKMISKISYTWTAFIRFPLSNLDSNINVVSSLFWSGTLACRHPARFPPIRDRSNFKKRTEKENCWILIFICLTSKTYVTRRLWFIIENSSAIVFVITSNERSEIRR